jgi:hypothetical protein
MNANVSQSVPPHRLSQTGIDELHQQKHRRPSSADVWSRVVCVWVCAGVDLRLLHQQQVQTSTQHTHTRLHTLA